MTCTQKLQRFADPLWRTAIGSFRSTGDLQVWRDELHLTTSCSGSQSVWLKVLDIRRLLRLRTHFGFHQEPCCWTSICQLVDSGSAEKTDHRNSPDKAEISLLGGAEEPPPQTSYRRTERMRNNEEKEEVIQVRKGEHPPPDAALHPREPVGAVIPLRNTNIEAWASSPLIFQFC